ncbi:MAG: MBL fold metallo-hydrolase [Syntrophomonadaceae bacterium]
MKRISENVIQMGNRHFNYFLVGNQEKAIIECGVTGGVQSVKSKLEELPNWPDVKYLVAMHAHFDHICGIPALKELFPQAKVLGSNDTHKVVSKPKILENFFYQDQMMSKTLVDEGILNGLPKGPPNNAIAIDQIIGEGDVIELNGLKIKVLEAPGHSPCSLACYLPEEQVMFLSDAAGFQISESEIFPIFFQSYKLYMETIKRLKGFPTRVLCLPHEQVWVKRDIDDFYVRAMESACWVFDSINSMLDAGWEEEKIVETLFNYYYRGNLRIYTPENITICVQLLIRRVKEYTG